MRIVEIMIISYHGLLILDTSFCLEPLKKCLKILIRSCESKDRKYNGQKKKDKRKNNDLQNIKQNTEDRATRIPLKTGGHSGNPEGLLYYGVLLVYRTHTFTIVIRKD